eukprot:1155076-Pelagomonas_calceolata.AAC.2
MYTQGEGPWQIDNELRPVEGSLVDRGGQHQPRSSSDCQIVFTPGHTAGHLCLYHQPSRTIFTGEGTCAPRHRLPLAFLLFVSQFQLYQSPCACLRFYSDVPVSIGVCYDFVQAITSPLRPTSWSHIDFTSLKNIIGERHLQEQDLPPKNTHTVMLLRLLSSSHRFSLGLQLQSVQKLLDLDFLHVLPGHGRMASFNSPMHRLQAVSNLLAEYEGRL